MAVKKLGLIKAIFVGTTPPTNTSVIWLDTSLATPLHKFYNTTTTSWEAFVYSTLIDNVTIKKNGSDQLYVDVSEIPALVIADGSIGLIKLEDVPTSTVFYRKSAGSGKPETQTLATLKADLGLTGTNSGDQDLSGYVLKITTINGKALTGNITLTPADIGSPAGSGTSTGTNTGDETDISILTKLGISSISGVNTGDQGAADVDIVDVGGLFTATEVEAALAEVKTLADENKVKSDASVVSYPISLPSSTTVAGRISAAVEGTDFPTGWVLSAGSNPVDIDITHNLNKRVASVTVCSVNGTEERVLFGSAAYSGWLTPDVNSLRIESLATITREIKIYMVFV